MTNCIVGYLIYTVLLLFLSHLSRSTDCQLLQILKIRHAHYFFFMAAMGPILPQLPVYGKQLGISPVVMGSVTGILPIMFLLAKPAFGFVADHYRESRKLIFISLVVSMGVFFAGLYLVPPATPFTMTGDCTTPLDSCNVTTVPDDLKCSTLNCTYNCSNHIASYLALPTHTATNICLIITTSEPPCPSAGNCTLHCTNVTDTDLQCTLTSGHFWTFVILMSAGSIGFNVINSISDAICFDVLGNGGEMGYGNQRVWGTIGFGLSALVSGCFVDWWSPGDIKSFTPALITMLAFLSMDVMCCSYLQLPVMETPKNIIKDVLKLLKYRHIRIFMIFAALAGIVDSFIVYFFFWYLEELAAETGHREKMKLLEGIVVAAETLGGEVLFFSVSGAILKVIGYGHSLSLCFVNYALRLGLISMIPSPWWVIPIELVFQGPTYAMCYTTIVAYASAISPPGTSATMQGLVAGIDDGFGYAIGSVVGGVLFRLLGGKGALQVFSGLALLCGIVHFILYRAVLKDSIPETDGEQPVQYLSPEHAAKHVTAD
ncbi:uncharacterized protein CBL_07841 [Carabus blaptoides fortunei]